MPYFDFLNARRCRQIYKIIHTKVCPKSTKSLFRYLVPVVLYMRIICRPPVEYGISLPMFYAYVRLTLKVPPILLKVTY